MASPTWPEIPSNVVSRTLRINDLEMHLFEASPPSSEPRPLLLLLHGFPELGYSWRKLMAPLSDAGYHVVAPDQRGFGRTKSLTQTSDTVHYDDDLAPFRALNLVKDIVSLVYTLGHKSVAAVVGHDFGSLIAGYCALIRPDIFQSVVIMSAPFTGPPSLPFNPSNALVTLLTEQLAALDRPRKHYAIYFSTPEANADMHDPPKGLHAFMRAYYHVKSADCAHSEPHRLPGLSASHLAILPYYYVMLLHETMPETVERDAPSPEEITNNTWLPENELAVYVSEYSRTGFQGGLNWYRVMMDTKWASDLVVFSGKRINVPAMFIAGKQDWGVFQFPGAVEAMREKVCENMSEEDFVLVDGAGHWVQQEKPDAVAEHLLRFLKKVRTFYIRWLVFSCEFGLSWKLKHEVQLHRCDRV
jgi:pimeloyl-ACP methyl ester carboxylesterase